LFLFAVLGGLNNTILGLFCGFLIREQSFPTFWLFMYWLNPLHYALEGLISSQFHGDTTPITMITGAQTTAEVFVEDYQYSTWSYSHVGLDVLALGLFISCAM
jgi:ABC-type multidrug transport system permease subunit